MDESSLSGLISNLSRQQGIIGKDRYLNTAVLVPLLLISGQYYLLFEKRSAQIRQGGEVSFPGGEIDKLLDKSLKDTAIRETIEELGIENSKIKLIGSLGSLIAPMGISLDVFVAELGIKNTNELRIDRNEVEKIFTVPVSYFKINQPAVYKVRVEAYPYYTNENGEKIELLPVEELGLPERYSKPWKNGFHRILVYKTEGEVIWGLTAEIVYEFSKLVP